jgi:hypothetical protein
MVPCRWIIPSHVAAMMPQAPTSLFLARIENSGCGPRHTAFIQMGRVSLTGVALWLNLF